MQEIKVTIQQLLNILAQTANGVSFPVIANNLKEIGVQNFTTFVEDGHSIFNLVDKNTLISNAEFGKIFVESKVNIDLFTQQLKLHQEGKTTFPTFIHDCAKSGIAYWTIDLDLNTCTYYDPFQNAVYIEEIPVVAD